MKTVKTVSQTKILRDKFTIEISGDALHTKDGGFIPAGEYYVYKAQGNKLWLGKGKVCVGMCCYAYDEATDSLEVWDAYADAVDLGKVNAELESFGELKVAEPKAETSKARKLKCGEWVIDESKMTATSPKGRTWKITEIIGEYKWAIMSKTGIEGFVVKNGYSSK